MDDTPTMDSGHDNPRVENGTPTTKRNLARRVLAWLNGVSVEPVLFLANIASPIVWIGSQDLMVEKACKVNYNYGDDICNNLNKHKEFSVRVQDMVSTFSMYKSIFETAVKVIFTLFLGSWGDRWGRRIPLIICLTGLLLESGMHLINSQIPSWGLETILISSVPYSLGGGTMTLLMLCFAHLADVSKLRQRTLRMGFLDSAYYLGAPVGNAIVGPLLDAWGYKGAFGLGIGIYGIIIIYVIARIYPIPRDEEENEEHTSLFDVTQLRDAVAVTVKPRPNRATFHIILLILAMMFDSLPVSGEGGLKYQFTKLSLSWSHTDYSHWSTFSSILSSLTMIIVIPLLSVVAGMPDGWMGVVGGVSRTASNFIYGFVNHPADSWLMWMGAVVASMKNMAPVAIRSLLSKLAGAKDVGKVYAVMATTESFVEFASAPMYNAVYTSTNDIRPGAYNFLSAGINIFLALTLLLVTLSLKRSSKNVPDTDAVLPVEDDSSN